MWQSEPGLRPGHAFNAFRSAPALNHREEPACKNLPSNRLLSHFMLGSNLPMSAKVDRTNETFSAFGTRIRLLSCMVSLIYPAFGLVKGFPHSLEFSVL